MLEKKELLKHLGKSYTLETTRFAGTPPLITALANNELEIADLTYPTLPVAIEDSVRFGVNAERIHLFDGASGVNVLAG